MPLEPDVFDTTNLTISLLLNDTIPFNEHALNGDVELGNVLLHPLRYHTYEIVAIEH